MTPRILALLLFAVVSCSAPAFANMAQPWHEGAVGAEPAGMPDIHVVNERLTFDLRASTYTGRARVGAIYELRNDGEGRAIELQFVAVGMTSVSSFAIAVAGSPTPAEFVPEHPIPPDWELPDSTPLPGGDVLPLGRSAPEGTAPSIRFNAWLPTGVTRVDVNYDLKCSEQSHGRYRVLQTAYVLAPARSWASFGSLRIKVWPPAGHHVAMSLPMADSDGYFDQNFKELPPDTFTISTHPRPPFGSLALFYVLWVGLLLCGSWLLTYVLVRRLLTIVPAGVCATIAGSVCSVAALWLGDGLLGEAAPGWVYDLLFVGTPLTALVAVVAGVMATLLVRHRSKRLDSGDPLR